MKEPAKKVDTKDKPYKDESGEYDCERCIHDGGPATGPCAECMNNGTLFEPIE